MSDTADIRQYLLCAGFPATGKTTFLAALWHTVTAGEIASALELQTLYEGDREYLNDRTQEWLEFRNVKRTLKDHPEPILMTLRRRSDGAVLRINVPDISGETFRVQFEDRWCTKAFDDRARDVSALLLFVHADKIKDPTKISAVNAAVQAWEKDAPEGGQPSDAQAQKPQLPAFTIQKCCTDVQCVDLLQLLLERIPARPLRVAVIVSAYDELDPTPYKDKPRAFVEKRLSLLSQFLEAHDGIQWTVYGLSAQGGRYEDNGVVEKLAAQGNLRVRVSGDAGMDNDITRPLRWLAFGAE